MLRRKSRSKPDAAKSSNATDTVLAEALRDDQLEQVAGGIGSQPTSAGSGRATFNPFSITKKLDRASP